jgi:predicted transcriptional regulator
MPTSDAEALHSSELTADIVTAFVAHNSLPIGSLAALIQSVHAALTQLAAAPLNSAPPAPPVEKQEPAVSIRKSITPDHLVCLDDGKKFKSLKRHLGALGMTPAQYRAKWRLPDDYPMVAPNYAVQRSALAKSIGLGLNRGKGSPEKGGRKPKASA